MPTKAPARGHLCGRFWINSGVLSRCFTRDPPQLCDGCSTVLYVMEFSTELDPLESFIGASSRFFFFIFFFFFMYLKPIGRKHHPLI